MDDKNEVKIEDLAKETLEELSDNKGDEDGE